LVVIHPPFDGVPEPGGAEVTVPGTSAVNPR
jgi:hypothetical protein